MADKKISQLTAATTPLAGTEVVPIVQNGSTKKVALGSIATQAASSVSITGGSVTGLSSLTTNADASVNGLTVGLGGGNSGLNTAVGGAALLSNTSGWANTAIGYQALKGNLSGAQNTTIGNNSLVTNTTGQRNTASGQGALYSNTTGSDNTANGTGALQNNTTGINNTSHGAQALFSNTTASKNTAVGYQAGYYITTGSKNTILGGYNGNQGGLDILTSNNNIVLSDGDGNPRVQVDSSGNTKIAVGNLVIGTAGKGIDFSANGGNVLAQYYEYTAPSANCTGAITTAAVWKATKVGNVVTLTLPSVVGIASAATNFVFGELLPTAFRPSATIGFVSCPIKDSDANVSTPGMIFILTSGAIHVYKDATATSNFTAGVNAGIGQSIGTSVSWTI